MSVLTAEMSKLKAMNGSRKITLRCMKRLSRRGLHWLRLLLSMTTCWWRLSLRLGTIMKYPSRRLRLQFEDRYWVDTAKLFPSFAAQVLGTLVYNRYWTLL